MGKEVFYVQTGRSVTSKKGILGEGAPVTEDSFFNSGDGNPIIDRLVKKGAIGKTNPLAKEEKPAEVSKPEYSDAVVELIKSIDGFGPAKAAKLFDEVGAETEEDQLAALADYLENK